jgi:exoribonuclease R
MRARRMAAGCINMNVPKLHFTLDAAGNPLGVKLYPYFESNRLIEEFMLLSNMAVARRISASFPDTSLLRIHPPPAEVGMAFVMQFCRAHDLPVPASISSIDMQQVSFSPRKRNCSRRMSDAVPSG